MLHAAVDHSYINYQCEKIPAEKSNRCDYDLCSDCARKNNEMGSKNECSKGHRLYPISVNAVGWPCRGWNCNGKECGYSWRPDQELDQEVVVWRCQHDFRKMSACPYTGTTVIEKIPWEGEAGNTQ